MKIGILTKPYLPIPSRAYGAIEKLVYSQVSELSKNKSNNYFLFAPGDSKKIDNIKLVSLFKKGVGGIIETSQVEILQATHCLERSQKIHLDLIHAHSVDPLLAFARFVEIPILFSFHTFPNEINKYLSKKANHLHYTFLSKSHRKSFPWIRNAHVVYPGIDPDNFPFSGKKDEYITFIGSVQPEKGIIEAVEIAEKSKTKLKIAAKIHPENRDFFKKEFLPRVKKSIYTEYLGEIDEQGRNKLLRRSKALLFPIKWNEPFGLVQLEALVVGTPIIAFNKGAVAEVIRDGKTGFVVENIKEAIKALKKIGTISPADCRKSVVDKFDSNISTQKYEKLYSIIAKNHGTTSH